MTRIGTYQERLHELLEFPSVRNNVRFYGYL
jgi:hypothetical protein